MIRVRLRGIWHRRVRGGASLVRIYWCNESRRQQKSLAFWEDGEDCKTGNAWNFFSLSICSKRDSGKEKMYESEIPVAIKAVFTRTLVHGSLGSVHSRVGTKC